MIKARTCLTLLLSLLLSFLGAKSHAATGAGIRLNEKLFERAFQKIVNSGAVNLEFGSVDPSSEYMLKCLTPKVRRFNRKLK